MSASSCPTCGSTVSAESRLCPACGGPLPDPEGVEARLRTYWSAPDLGVLAGVALAGVGILLVGLQAWLWGALALALAAVVLLLRWEAGRRETGAALGTARARLGTHRRVVGARSRGQLELFRLRRELAELQSERSRGYYELGRATHGGDAAAAGAAKTQLDDVGARIAGKEAEIAALVGEMDERVRQVQAEVAPTSRREALPEPARVPEPSPEPVPAPSPEDPPPRPEHPPAPETKRRRRLRAPKA